MHSGRRSAAAILNENTGWKSTLGKLWKTAETDSVALENIRVARMALVEDGVGEVRLPRQGLRSK